MSSRLPGFYKKSPLERRELIAQQSNIHDEQLFEATSLPIEKADVMVENAIGTFALPLAIAVNFNINNEDVLIPMVVIIITIMTASGG